MIRRERNWESRIGRRLKLRDLDILSTVAECGSMAKGARQLGMSQPAVSEIDRQPGEHAAGATSRPQP